MFITNMVIWKYNNKILRWIDKVKSTASYSSVVGENNFYVLVNRLQE